MAASTGQYLTEALYCVARFMPKITLPPSHPPTHPRRCRRHLQQQFTARTVCTIELQLGYTCGWNRSHTFPNSWMRS